MVKACSGAPRSGKCSLSCRAQDVLAVSCLPGPNRLQGAASSAKLSRRLHKVANSAVLEEVKLLL